MTAQLADKLRPFGIDYVDAMDRFGDNAELYERLALKYWTTAIWWRFRPPWRPRTTRRATARPMR